MDAIVTNNNILMLHLERTIHNMTKTLYY